MREEVQDVVWVFSGPRVEPHVVHRAHMPPLSTGLSDRKEIDSVAVLNSAINPVQHSRGVVEGGLVPAILLGLIW